MVARVVLQDFTGVPLLADLAAMRNVAKAMGKDAKTIEPLVPVDLVVDHSIMIDYFGSKKALDLNMKLEFKRNLERYQFMKWGMQAFDTFGVVPPGFGIVHQVNLEYLARGVHKGAAASDGPAVYYPDSLVGTDSHTTMINGIGVVGWGVGGIEAEAAMLGQPVYFLTPDVVGFEFTGRLREGVTATDLVLAVTEILRKEKVVGKFVEFFGDGTESLSVPDRATMANMAPEYGATMGFFPVDDKTIEYFEGTGSTASEIESFQAYFKAQGLYGMPRAGEIDYTPGRPPRPRHRRRRAWPGPSGRRTGSRSATSRRNSRRCSASRPPRTASTSPPPRCSRAITCGPRKRAATRRLFGCRRRRRSRPVHRASSRRWPPTSRRSPPPCTRPSRAARADREDDRQRRRADRRDHLVHEHLEPERDARRRPAGEEGGRGRPQGAAAHQDLARTGLAHRHRVPHQGRSAALPRQARLLRSPPTAARPASATPAT